MKCECGAFSQFLKYKFSMGSVHFENFYYKNLYFVVWLKYF